MLYTATQRERSGVKRVSRSKMSGIYEEPKQPARNLRPYPYEEPGVEYGRVKDPVKYLQSLEQRARERQVAIETVRLVRQKVINCYRKEGVNHFDNCKKEKQDYYDLIIQKDYGQLQPEKKE